jgi:thiopeptide-type bacteriocin biosynthesis protein
VQGWRERTGAPRWVALADGDNELTLDLDNVVCLDVLVEALRPGRPTPLLELFPTADDLCVRGPGGRYMHELLVPFAGQAPGPARLPVTPRAPAVTRRFAPGSEWLYLRLYGGPGSADRVLVDTVGPLTASARAAGLIDRWFFLRYADPEPHLRVRWHGPAAGLTGELLPAVHAALDPLLRDGVLWRVDAGTYEREVERYGGPATVELAEEIFEADSDAVLALLGTVDDDLAEFRWRLALAGADRLLRDLRLPFDARREWARRTREHLLAEHGGGADLAREIGRRFRPGAAELAALLDGRSDDAAVADGLRILDARSARLAPLVDRLDGLDRDGLVTEFRDQLAASLVHMHVNRMIRDEQRTAELVLADWLERLYRGVAARSGSR